MSRSLCHLRSQEAPAHSTLAYAIQHRPWEFCRTLVAMLIASLTAQLALAEHVPRLVLPHRPLCWDSTMIDRCAKVFDWAKECKAKGAVKLHLLLNHEGLLSHDAVVSEGRNPNIAMAGKLHLPAASMRVIDSGSHGYKWFPHRVKKGAHSVTRRQEPPPTSW